MVHEINTLPKNGVEGVIMVINGWRVKACHIDQKQPNTQNMKYIYPLILLNAPVAAATLFTGTGDFNTAGNWDLGLPDNSNGPGEITAGATATMSSNYLMANDGSPSVTDIIVRGTLNTGANELQLRSGGVARTSDLTIDGGILNVNAGGLIDIAGAAADAFVTNGGTITFDNGSTAQISKALEVINGSLNFGAGTSWSGTLQDEFVIDDSGTLSFGFDNALNHLTIPGSSLAVELGATSTLSLNFDTAPTTGSTFTLITDANFSGVAGGTGTGVFGTVNATGLAAGQSVTVDYGVNTPGELQISVVPEPSSAALLGLAGLSFLVRRKR